MSKSVFGAAPKAIRATAIFITLLATTHSLAAAQVTKLTPAAGTLLDAWIVFAPNAATRLRFAQALLDYCTDMDKRIPRNSPREDDWLKGELDTRDTSRVERAVASIEYGRKTLTEAFVKCLTHSRQLTVAQLPHPTVQATLWVRLAMALNNSDDLERAAARVGLIDPTTDTTDIYGVRLLGGVRYSLMQTATDILEEFNSGDQTKRQPR